MYRRLLSIRTTTCSQRSAASDRRRSLASRCCSDCDRSQCCDMQFAGSTVAVLPLPHRLLTLVSSSPFSHSLTTLFFSLILLHSLSLFLFLSLSLSLSYSLLVSVCLSLSFSRSFSIGFLPSSDFFACTKIISCKPLSHKHYYHSYINYHYYLHIHVSPGR